ncbi:MAG: hypothetical protein K2P09_04060, partial [Erysipelotrichales bacterium]|nr:hypothetical protein [Erysipelotrichales bacterium]
MKKIILGVVVVIVTLFYIEMTQFRAVDHIRYDGYALTTDDVESFLMGDDLNTNGKTVSLLKVSETQEIF